MIWLYGKNVGLFKNENLMFFVIMFVKQQLDDFSIFKFSNYVYYGNNKEYIGYIKWCMYKFYYVEQLY